MAQTKIGFTGKLRPTGVDQTAGQNLRMLAGLSDQVGELAFNQVAKTRQKEGALAGAQSVKRDEEGKVLSPELESDNTIFGQSFNQSAILAHKAQVSMDSRESLDRLQEEHKLDPEAFKVAAMGMRKGTLTGMPEELAVLVGQDIDSSISNRHAKLLNNQFKRESEQQRATALASIETQQDDLLNAVREGDAEEQARLAINANAELDAWVESGKISADEARKIKEDTAERIQEQSALREVDQIVFNEDLSLEEQFAKGSDFVEQLRKSKLKDLSPEQKDSLVNVVESRVNDVARKIANESRQRDIETEKLISNIKIQANLIEERAKNGENVDLAPLVEQTELLHTKGSIKGNERTSIFTHVAKAQDEINRITLADKRIIARQEGDNTIEMKQKDVDSYYKRNIQDDISQLPPEMQSLANANFIAQTRTIPSQVKSQITSQVLSGDPDQIKQASDLVDRIDNIPGMPSAVSADQRAFMDSVVTLSQSMEPEQAIKLARELTDPRDKARIEAREQLIKDDKLREDYPSKVENAFEGFFGGDFLQDNINKQAVEAEYSALFESFFKAGMSEDNAEAKAVEILQNNWKESQFGFMKNRPEDYYSVNGNSDYIKPQLIRDIKKSSIGMEFENDNVFLLSDEETSRKASLGAPDYRVIVIDSNGEFQSIPGRWSPDASVERGKLINEREEQFKEKRGQKKAIEDLQGVF